MNFDVFFSVGLQLTEYFLDVFRCGSRTQTWSGRVRTGQPLQVQSRSALQTTTDVNARLSPQRRVHVPGTLRHDDYDDVISSSLLDVIRNSLTSWQLNLYRQFLVKEFFLTVFQNFPSSKI